MRNSPLSDVFRRPGRPAVSVEFFPPKDETAGQAMLEAARTLKGLGVDFASITYGAGGSSRDTTLHYGARLVEMGYPMVGHLTCVGHTRQDSPNWSPVTMTPASRASWRCAAIRPRASRASSPTPRVSPMPKASSA